MQFPSLEGFTAVWLQHQQLQEQLNSTTVRPHTPGRDILLLFRDPCHIPAGKYNTQKISLQLWGLPAAPGEGGTATGSPLVSPELFSGPQDTLQDKYNPRDQGEEQGVQTVVARAERAPGTSLAAESGRNAPVASGHL